MLSFKPSCNLIFIHQRTVFIVNSFAWIIHICVAWRREWREHRSVRRQHEAAASCKAERWTVSLATIIYDKRQERVFVNAAFCVFCLLQRRFGKQKRHKQSFLRERSFIVRAAIFYVETAWQRNKTNWCLDFSPFRSYAKDKDGTFSHSFNFIAKWLSRENREEVARAPATNGQFAVNIKRCEKSTFGIW